MKKIIRFMVGGFMLLNFYGCVALLAGTAGGAGTAAWLSGKLVQEVPSPYERCIEAAKEALKSMHSEVFREIKGKEVNQIRSHYSDGRKIWIDIRPITDHSSRIEVRVGMKGDKAASDDVLKQIIRRL